jgi:hypothetical protein
MNGLNGIVPKRNITNLKHKSVRKAKVETGIVLTLVEAPTRCQRLQFQWYLGIGLLCFCLYRLQKLFKHCQRYFGIALSWS